MKEFDEIFLSWRLNQGKRRHIIGVIRKDQHQNFTFEYLQDSLRNAQKDGFDEYTGLPMIDKPYKGDVLNIFTQRLIKSERADIQSFYDFWEIEPQFIDDKFYLLAHTQGLLPTDNFEFLADYNPIKGLHFLTDLAHISEAKIKKDSIKRGDALTYKLEKNNLFDKDAVIVYHQGQEVGYIKKIHCKVFHKDMQHELKLKVKAVEQNGYIKKIFVVVTN